MRLYKLFTYSCQTKNKNGHSRSMYIQMNVHLNRKIFLKYLGLAARCQCPVLFDSYMCSQKVLDDHCKRAVGTRNKNFEIFKVPKSINIWFSGGIPNLNAYSNFHIISC